MMMEAESSVMASFDFLSGGMEVDDDDDMGDDLDDVEDELKQPKRKVRVILYSVVNCNVVMKLFNWKGFPTVCSMKLFIFFFPMNNVQ